MPAVDDDFSVAAAAKRVAQRIELLPNFREVVDLAVIRDPDSPIRARHRLVSGRREIDDRQPRVSDPGSAIGPNAFIIRPAMPQGRDHRPKSRFGRIPRQCCAGEKPANAAHSVLSLREEQS